MSPIHLRYALYALIGFSIGYLAGFLAGQLAR